jgi:hypothetical protein
VDVRGDATGLQRGRLTSATLTTFSSTTRSTRHTLTLLGSKEPSQPLPSSPTPSFPSSKLYKADSGPQADTHVRKIPMPRRNKSSVGIQSWLTSGYYVIHTHKTTRGPCPQDVPYIRPFFDISLFCIASFFNNLSEPYCASLEHLEAFPSDTTTYTGDLSTQQSEGAQLAPCLQIPTS